MKKTVSGFVDGSDAGSRGVYDRQRSVIEVRND